MSNVYQRPIHDEFEQNTLTVVGYGQVSGVPDEAEWVLGVVTEGDQIELAQEKNDNTTAAVIEALKQSGVAEQGISTVTYRIEPRYDYVEGQEQFRGYEVTHLLQASTEQIAEVGSIVDAAVKAGANRVVSITFTSSETEALQRQALREATLEAQAKAQVLAETLNVMLNEPPMEVVEIPSDRIQSEAMFSASVKQAPIQPGSIVEGAAIKLTYSF
ncbi:SIMPL domain-containing protein [Bacillaceae bacterium SIJ1]|uniref:SIMPL domain-containing protein n=1 Tax=Litoribacterium kuwaitense TaxID=1398745 RepID=UPI0013ED841F|nr:SIMPL domain-containing protein [Litoribacterium kuwaitense]NGP45759.1 SIMPL domain-containing protein [Litoribacterium kuwaitense]